MIEVLALSEGVKAITALGLILALLLIVLIFWVD